MTEGSYIEKGPSCMDEMGLQLCAGLRVDCARLAGLIRDRLTVQSLFDAWKETQFQRVFTGRRNFAEQYEFTEEALILVRELWLDSCEIREQASYFLILAGLYLRQPFTNPSRPVRIQLTSSHFNTLAKFVDECNANELHDCVRLMDSLFSQGAFDFTTHSREFGLEQPTLAYLRRDASLRASSTAQDTKLRDTPALSDLRMTLAKYCMAKRDLEWAPKLVTEERLESLVSRVKEENDTDSDSDDSADKEWTPDGRGEEAGGDDIAARRQKLKHRAFAKTGVQKESVVFPKVEVEAVVEEPAVKEKRNRVQKLKKFY